MYYSCVEANFDVIFVLQIEQEDIQKNESSNGSTFSEMLFSAAIKQDKDKVKFILGSS